MPSDEDLALLLSLADMESESPPSSAGGLCLGSPTMGGGTMSSVVAGPSHAVAGGDRGGIPVDFESSGGGNKQPRVRKKCSSGFQVMSPAKIPALSNSKGDGSEPEPHAAHGEATGSAEFKGHKRKSADVPNLGVVNQNASSNTSLKVRKLPASFAKSQAEVGTSSRSHARNPSLRDPSAAVPPARSDHLPINLMDCITILAENQKPKIDMRALADMDILEVLKLKGIDFGQHPLSKTWKEF